ncbi:hypothetical protein NKB77_004905 [Salmonella enterica]|nr:hypothetical protein [Salmonella enterica]
MKKRSTINISQERKEKIESIAHEISYISGVTILWTDIVNSLIDNVSLNTEKIAMDSKKDNILKNALKIK